MTSGLKRQMIPWQEMNRDEKPRLGEAVRRRRQLEDQIARLESLKKRPAEGAPPEVALALGSAYFHTGRSWASPVNPRLKEEIRRRRAATPAP